MCGLAGILYGDGRTAQTADLETMAIALRHRGPDGSGTINDAEFGMAHTRLAIVDRSAGARQPFTDGSFTLAFNGEIYNHASLRPELEARGVRFESSSDTATLFHALRVLGVPETLRRIRGMFAISFFDHQTRALHLCRDRFGIKPLYWVRRGGNVFWTSEIKALRHVVDLKPDVFKTMLSIAGGGNTSHRYSVFTDVEHIPPGSHVCIKDGVVTTEQYYRLADDFDASYRSELNAMSFGEATSIFRSHLRRGVESMLMSDAQVGALVSGGLDSSLIAVLAQECGKTLPLFTSDVVGQYSELGDAQALADHAGLPLHVSRFEADSLLNLLSQATWHHESPLIENMSGVPFGQVCGLARDHGVKVLLSGEGADELFVGYTLQHSQRFVDTAMLPFGILERIYSRTPFLRDALKWRRRASVGDFMVLVSREFERQRFRSTIAPFFNDQSAADARRESTPALAMHEHLISLLHRNDRMGMQSGIEARFPFLDEEMVRFGVNLPAKHRTQWAMTIQDKRHPFLTTKAMIRAVGKPLLPPRLIAKRKVGFHMHTLEQARFKPEFFANGYLAQVAGMTSGVIRHLLDSEPAGMVGRLAAIEVFGQLYGMGETPVRVAERLARYATFRAPGVAAAN